MSAEETTAAQEAQKVAPTPENVTAEASRPSGDTSSQPTMASSYKDLEEFRKKAPEIYNKFMETIQQSIVDDFKRRSKKLIEAMKKMRKENS